MKVLVVTGRLARSEVIKAVRDAHIDGIEVGVLDVDVAAFINSKKLISYLKERENLDFDMILVSGLITSDFSEVEEKFSIPVRLGPKHAYDLRYVLPLLGEVELSKEIPACVLLAEHMRKRALDDVSSYERDAVPSFTLRNVKIGGNSRMKVLAEVVDADKLDSHELCEKVRYFVENGADMIDLGISFDADENDVKRCVKHVRKVVGCPVSVDTLSPELILAGVEAGCDLVLSINNNVMDELEEFEESIAYVVVPDNGHGIMENLEKARSMGAKKLIADPLLEIKGSKGLVKSIQDYIEFRIRDKKTPLFFGVGNVVELFDADSVGMNAVLSAIGYELGVSILFTPEYSPKTRGSVRELWLSSCMMVLSKIRNTPPKDLGIDLLVLKEKRRRPSLPSSCGCVEGVERDIWRRDPKGSYTINISDDGYIIARHTDGWCVRGRSAKEVYDTILERDGISSIEHALYLGKELARAELALKLGRSYAQDDIF